MSRIENYADFRRQELLDFAQRAFLERGYDNVSLNDLIIGAGISKGVFYHYFSSKEELIAALAERYAAQALAQVGNVLHDESLLAVDRLNAFLERGWQNKIETARSAWALFGIMYRPENQLLFQRITAAIAASFVPTLTAIIRKGVEDNSFHTDDPEGAAELFLQLASSTQSIVAKVVADDDWTLLDETIETLEKRIRVYEIALNAVLGIPDHTVQLSKPGYVRAIMTACKNESRRAMRKKQSPRSNKPSRSAQQP